MDNLNQPSLPQHWTPFGSSPSKKKVGGLLNSIPSLSELCYLRQFRCHVVSYNQSSLVRLFLPRHPLNTQQSHHLPSSSVSLSKALSVMRDYSFMAIFEKISQWLWGRPQQRNAAPSFSSFLDAIPPPPYKQDEYSLPLDTCNKSSTNRSSSLTNAHHHDQHTHSDLTGEKSESFLHGNILLLFSQHPRALTGGWHALMSIQADDMPRLMRDGLHWTEANLDREAGYVELNPQVSIRHPPPPFVKFIRVYYLRDLGAKPLWTAKMAVCFSNTDQLSQFQFCDLKLDHVTVCTAESADHKLLYAYQRISKFENINFNTIYDDMPLEGWWPWPKRSTKDNK